MTPFSILHISDLHFGKLPEPKGRLFCHQWQPPEKEDFVSLCHKALQDARIQPDFVVLCGDMVCSGSEASQHTEAAQAIIRLCKGLCKFRSPQDWARLLIVPGNHEVDRNEPVVNLRFSKHVEHFLRTVYANADEETLRMRVPTIDPQTGFTPENPTWPRLARINNHPVEFVYLYSPVLDDSILLPREVQEFLASIPDPIPVDEDQLKRRKDLPWSFDRGFIGSKQLAAVKTALQGDHNPKNVLRIGLIHHNVLPICRKSTEGDQLTSPDVHLLANGMELVEQLIRKDVGVILHGHRHENALRLHSHEDPKRALTLIGAPTAGLKEAMLDEALGFNVIDVLRNNLSWRCRVRTFQYGSENQVLAFRCGASDERRPTKTRNQSDFVDIRKDPEPFELLTSLRGVEQLATLMEESAEGPTILHFTVKANWFPHDSRLCAISPGADGTPFYQVWGPPAQQPDVRAALARKLEIWHADSGDAKEFALELKATAEQGIIAPGLLKRLRKHTSQLSIKALRRRQDDAFAKHIFDNVRYWHKAGSKDQLDRRVNYALELYRLAIDPNFRVMKCIHICPVRLDTTKYGQKWTDSSRVKFTWLLNSAFASSGMNNCILSWMPFCFHERFNQTLVSIDSGDPSNKEPRGVFVGWGPGEDYDGPIDEDLEDDHDYSVFQWHEDHAETEGIGALGRDIRGCLEKVIHPLSHRLAQDFPLLRDGRVFVDNLKYVARVCGFAEEEEQLEQYAQNAPQHLIAHTPKIKEEQIVSLFNWVLSNEIMAQLVASGSVLPWLEKDCELALRGVR